MRITVVLGLALAFLALAGGTAWAFSASVNVYITNDNYADRSVDIELGDGTDKVFTVDSGDEYEYSYAATAWLWEAETYDFDVYVSEDFSDGTYCSSSIAVETWWDFGVQIGRCFATEPDPGTCAVATDTYGTTCQISITIN